MDIIKNPTTVKMLAAQLIYACDGYISKKLSEKQLRELLFHYASKHGKKLFSVKGFNPTVTNRIGKKRLELVNIMLEGFQQKLF
ncbi:TIGR04540 family protein [Herbivorax sp. ANBcel31]|uniref:TIGR04540 family protein n=1 Tax=Herbivorax sp. ANBcel31 TaxID=3069754 RepID=UPI0027B40070|nr:TIGR04540 family protein [Herbivorax sp. ANBcel31]MDQ2087949.1 TIGR04540 family protein [Herbivorax sp. ANBcel31]